VGEWRVESGEWEVESNNSEILPHWRFKTPAIAQKSASKIYKMFLDYKAKDDFVGMNMARKFLQMGYTRSRQYANRKAGYKWGGVREALVRRDCELCVG
jgi:hypothetical protein